jgi:hypothetical protein
MRQPLTTRELSWRGNAEFDRFDVTALVCVAGSGLATIDWAEDRLMRVACLIELEGALIALNPKIGVARWIAAPNPGPFFGGNSQHT